MSETKAMIERVRTLADDAAQDWLRKNADGEEIRSKVFQLLDGALNSVTAKLLGFDNRWGRNVSEWELDHCNGRAGESAAGDYIRKEAHAAVVKWLRQTLDGLPEPTAGVKRAAKREYQAAFQRELKERAREQGIQDAQEQVAAILAEGREGK